MRTCQNLRGLSSTRPGAGGGEVEQEPDPPGPSPSWKGGSSVTLGPSDLVPNKAKRPNWLMNKISSSKKEVKLLRQQFHQMAAERRVVCVTRPRRPRLQENLHQRLREIETRKFGSSILGPVEEPVDILTMTKTSRWWRIISRKDHEGSSHSSV